MNVANTFSWLLALGALAVWNLPNAAARDGKPHVIVFRADDAGYADFGFQGSSTCPTPKIDSLCDKGVWFTDAHVSARDIAATAFAPEEAPAVDPAQKQTNAAKPNDRPNIVFLMADDWSWPHAGILGDPVVKTPNFDRIANEGVLFENAFVSTPSCTPSRLSILTGQHHWRLKEGDSLGGSLREEFDVYTEMLQKSGYRIGRFGKGVWPSKMQFRKRDSFGERYRSFDEFLTKRKPGEPFCYWHGGQDPHRPYELGIGAKSGIDLSQVKVPACLPDNETVRSDVADYLWEVQRFDREVGAIVARIEAMGELDNTIIVVSGDNGMPFPRCKATLYDLGTRVPLAIRWGSKTRGNRNVTDFTSLCDLAPTFLEAAGLKPSEQMTGRSLLPLLESNKSGQIDPARTFVLTGVEKHVYSYPKRALRTADFLYIRNFEPDEWPTGEIEGHNPQYDFAQTPWPTENGAFSFAIDPSPSKQFLRLNRNDPKVTLFAELSFGRRPAEELYDLRTDPDQLRNVISDARYTEPLTQSRRQFVSELGGSNDPRIVLSDDRVAAPPVHLGLSSFYEKYVSASSYPVVSSGKVNDYALKEAAYLIDMMLAERPDVRKAMIASGSRMIVMARDEFTSDIPEHSHLRPEDWWDARARGLGGSRDDAVCSCGEENLLGLEGDPYASENILIHEFAHNIHYRGLVNVDSSFDDRLKQTYERAMAQGLWEGKYASTNHAEYFAEGVQSWFNNNRQPDHDHNHVDTRKELKEYDPGLASICEEVFGTTELVYTKPATRLTGHLAGYDPAKAPKFEWPTRLQKIKEQIREEARQQSKNRKQEYKH